MKTTVGRFGETCQLRRVRAEHVASTRPRTGQRVLTEGRRQGLGPRDPEGCDVPLAVRCRVDRAVGGGPGDVPWHPERQAVRGVRAGDRQWVGLACRGESYGREAGPEIASPWSCRAVQDHRCPRQTRPRASELAAGNDKGDPRHYRERQCHHGCATHRRCTKAHASPHETGEDTARRQSDDQ